MLSKNRVACAADGSNEVWSKDFVMDGSMKSSAWRHSPSSVTLPRSRSRSHSITGYRIRSRP